MSIYQFQAKSILGQPVELSTYRNKVLLIVNTASRCGYSRQFADLEQLYEFHREQGFEILGFPCNQFNEKEPWEQRGDSTILRLAIWSDVSFV